jgi:ribosomal protein S18 acetylase RimI-like enzyme
VDFFVRPFHPSDWNAICQIHDLARPDELKGSCDLRAFIPIEEDQEVDHLKKCYKYVAVADEKIVGFIGLDGGYIGWLYVHPDFYSQGIGRKLLQTGIGKLTENAWTIVLDGNARAIDLYQSEGFQEVRRYQSDNAGYPCTCIRLERDIDYADESLEP